MILAIETRSLTCIFGDIRAVDVVYLRLERGTFYGILGPNGAVKATTIKILTGLLAPSEGDIFVLGRNMRDPKQALDAKRHMGVIAENLSLFDNLTAREYLIFVGRMYLLDRGIIRTRSEELLALLGLADEH